MAFTPGNSNGVLNGTTQVDCVAAPAAATQRMVRRVRVFNRDTVAQTITLLLDVSGTDRTLDKQTVQPDTMCEFELDEVLDATTKKLQLVMGAAATTTNPDFSASWADKT